MAQDKLLAEWFWIDRWMGGSAFLLPMEARGLYREMLTQAWRRGARLPNDHEAIRRAIGAMEKEWKRGWLLVERFWRLEGDYLVNDTQLEVYAEAMRRMDVNGRRAKQGAQARWKDKPNIGLSNAQALPQASHQALPEQCPPISGLQSPDLKTSLERAVMPKPSAIYDAADGERAGRLVERYGQLFLQHRSGARYRQRPNLDWHEALTLVPVWDDARLEKLAVLVLTTDDPWISSTDRGFKIFAMKASWADDRLRAWETEHGVAV